MASSSSSHQQNEERLAFSGIEPPGKRRMVSESSRLFDVFINHRGPDVKDTLATQLYNSLQELGIRAFLDSKEKELGDSFPSAIETAIRSASVHIAIFSKRYAESAWCLAELVLMLESQAKIIPVFYGVEPWELRHIEKGVYADAFTNYRKKSRYSDRLKEWKEALLEVSLIIGFEFDNSESASSSSGLDFSNSDEDIVEAVQKEVKRKKPLFVSRYPVALKNLVEDFEQRCVDGVVQDFERRCDLNVKGIIGIYAMGGAGKSTLAKELFNRKCSEYTRGSFLFDVREAYARNELPSLQRKLLKDLFNEEPPSFQSIEEGTCILRERQRKSKKLSFLIVLDDIDDVKQLDALLLLDMQNIYANSLVIVTTRDEGVLIRTGISIRYSLKGMNRDDGRELFCWHSFGQSHPASGYENLVEDFLQVCGGLPLSLQVLGRHVYGRSEQFWLLELNNARRNMHGDVKDRLKISIDSLNWEEKQIFMDIACFFVNKPKSVAIRSWEGSGWSAQLALERLKDKCLVEEIEIWRLDGLEPMWVWDQGTDLGLRMHDHLRDLGREMANELTSPHRLWNPQHLKSLESEGFQNILSQTRGRCFHSIFDKSLNCRITYFLGASHDSKESISLLWLQLDYLDYHHRDLNATIYPGIPSWIPLQNLQCLRINNGQLERLWQSNIQAPSQLKELQIAHTSLEKFPDLSRIADNLEMVIIDGEDMSTVGWSFLPSLNPCSLILMFCTLRGELASDYRGRMTTFKSSCSTSLVIWNLKVSGKLALNYSMNNLKSVEISNQELLTAISISGHHCPNLESLKLHDMEDLIEADFMGVTNLVVLDISDCHKLEGFCFSNVSSLQRIRIKNCKSLKRVSGISDLSKLVELNISVCPELVLEFCLVGTDYLERIRIDRCWKVQCFELDVCKKLKSVSGSVGPEKLVTINIRECPELEELADFQGLICLERIRIDICGKLNFLQLYRCQNLKRVLGNFDLAGLSICDCPELEEFPCFAHLTRLEEISIVRCGKLLNACAEFKSASGLIFEFSKLVKLNIFGFPEFEELSVAHLSCLERMKIVNCQNLRGVSGIFDLSKLIKLKICKCPELEELPSLARLTRLKYLDIYKCEKLQSISGIQQLGALKRLIIKNCPELEELPCLAQLRCLGYFNIYKCEKLQGITGIQQLRALKDVQLAYCSNAVMRNCIDMLQIVPSEFMGVIGRAGDGAESTVNQPLFDGAIDAEAVTKIDPCSSGPLKMRADELSAVMVCVVVVVDSSTQLDNVNHALSLDCRTKGEYRNMLRNVIFKGKRFHTFYFEGEGEWIITKLITDQYRIFNYINGYQDRLYEDFFTKYGIWRKGFRVTVKKGEEWKTLHVLKTIVNRLHEN